MSRTKKGKKSPGYEYWSRRPNSMSSPGRVSKTVTKKKERAVAKQALYKETKK